MDIERNRGAIDRHHPKALIVPYSEARAQRLRPERVLGYAGRFPLFPPHLERCYNLHMGNSKPRRNTNLPSGNRIDVNAVTVIEPPPAALIPSSALTLNTVASDRPIAADDNLSIAPRRTAYTPEEVDDHCARLNAYVPTSRYEHEDKKAYPLHEARYLAWLSGMTWKEIAEVESTHETGVRRSCFYFLLKLPLLEQIQIRNSHTMARAHNEHNDKYFDELKRLLDEKSWPARSAALKHFRRTVGLEGASTVTVSIDQRKQSVHMGAPGRGANSFEQAMNKVRQLHAQDASRDTPRESDDIDADEVNPQQGLTPDAEGLGL